MKISLSKEGPNFSRLVYGCWRLHTDPKGSGVDRILEKIEVCLESGIDTFDHADLYGEYGNEEKFGAVLKSKPGLKDKIKIVTKAGIQLPGPNRPGISVKHYNTSGEYLISSAENSLKKLNIDKIDLLLIHRPDPLMDADEIAKTFKSLKESGKVLHFGVSNFTPSQFSLLQSRLDFPLVTNQVEFHPFYPDPLTNGVFDLAQELSIKPMIWSPTAGGRVFQPKTEQETVLYKTLEEIAKKKSVTIDAVLFSWYLFHPAQLVPVLGTNEPDRIRSAAKSFQVQLEREEWFQILEAGTGRRVP
ncbi:oxidoreductase [Leptospira selangorensis]|uniref:Oxidoreductase n=1 Tax=Leptospira selangorensis TaxID=2484982 RepID=A0A5F2BXD9_9LEPT|nr:aldo/keto reductase [Leptospira selangorensis]TGM12274.1 oxidoreductase [Leptospira selangorensis]TGM14683.1 oxidoreductase [Leptospira selangorensis]